MVTSHCVCEVTTPITMGSTLPSTSSERNTVIHHVRTIMVSMGYWWTRFTDVTQTPLDAGDLNIVQEEHCSHHVVTIMGTTLACQHLTQHCPVPHQRGHCKPSNNGTPSVACQWSPLHSHQRGVPLSIVALHHQTTPPHCTISVVNWTSQSTD